jgi:hypothetical protein
MSPPFFLVLHYNERTRKEKYNPNFLSKRSTWRSGSAPVCENLLPENLEIQALEAQSLGRSRSFLKQKIKTTNTKQKRKYPKGPVIEPVSRSPIKWNPSIPDPLLGPARKHTQPSSRKSKKKEREVRKRTRKKAFRVVQKANNTIRRTNPISEKWQGRPE